MKKHKKVYSGQGLPKIILGTGVSVPMEFGILCMPGGVPGHKACAPPFLDYRKQASFSLHDLPWVPTGIIKQLLIREGRGWEIKEKQSRAALGPGPSYPSMDTCNSIFEIFCRYRNLLQVGEVKHVDPTSMQTSNQLDLKVDDADFYLPHH